MERTGSKARTVLGNTLWIPPSVKYSMPPVLLRAMFTSDEVVEVGVVVANVKVPFRS